MAIDFFGKTRPAGAGTPGPAEPVDITATVSSSAPNPSSFHLNCGGSNSTWTDSAGVIWRYDLPFIISPGPQQFVLGAPDSVSGISAPLDQGDIAHVAILNDMRYDTSSTLNAGLPGVLEYSFSIQGNFQYTLRVWGAEVAGSGNVTGGRVTTISYDYGAGTTATLASTFDSYALAGAYSKAAYLEQQFTITATGAQSLRLQLNGGGANDVNPLISALELTGVAQSLAVPLGPEAGLLRFLGHPIFVSIGLRPPLTSGLVTFKGAAVAQGTKTVVKSAASGSLLFKGLVARFSTGSVRTPSAGRVMYVGQAADLTVPQMLIRSPQAGKTIFVGRPANLKMTRAVWTETAAPSATWSEIPQTTVWR